MTIRQPILTIILPTYNRVKLLKKFFESVDYFSDELEILVIDDNSSDGSKKLIKNSKYNLHPIKFQYLFNEKNLGRAPCLQKGLNNASGLFSMFMDSDDYFIKDGISNIIHYLKLLIKFDYPLDIKGLVFGCKFEKHQTDFSNIANCTLTNFTNLRVKYLNKGDLKEVFYTELIRKIDYSKILNLSRRIPTRLLLDPMSKYCKILIIPKLVIYKTYQENGLSSQLKYKSFFKREMLPLLLFYRDLLLSRSYRSIKFRFIVFFKTTIYGTLYVLKLLLDNIK